MKTDLKRSIPIGLFIQLIFSYTVFAQQKTLATFNAIKANGAFDLYVTQSDSHYVKIEADSGSRDKIRAEVENGTLTLAPDGRLKKANIKVYVGAKGLNRIDVNGAVDLKSLSQITADRIDISTNGSGDITLNIKADKVNATARGAGDIRLSGSSRELDAEATGAGDIKAFELETEQARVRASGAGDIRINVKSKLDAQTSGAGDIQYKGNPQERNVNISGAGSIRQAGASAGAEEGSEGDTTRIRVGKKKLIIVSDEEDDDDDDDADDDDTDVNIQWEDTDKDDDHHEHHKHHEHGEQREHREHRDRERKEKRSADLKHWTGVYIASTGYLNANNELSLPKNFEFLELDYSRSLAFGINFLEKDIHLYKNYVNLVTGMGIEFNGYSFKDNITLRPDTNYVAYTKNNEADFSKNKLKTIMLQLPLMLEFNTRPDKERKTYHLAVGALLGYKVSSKTKQVYELNGKKYKEKVKDDYNLAPFRYSATIRAGYGDFTLFANYALSTFFEKNKGPQLYPFSIGINLSL